MQGTSSRGSKLGRCFLIGALVVGGGVVTSTVWAQNSNTNTTNTPQQSEADAVTARAKIQKIDKNSRTVTLRDMKGRTLDVQVGPNVNLDALHTGDVVQATYYESVAVAMRSPGGGGAEPRTGATERMVERPGVTVRQTTVNARVASVDLKNDTVTFDLPQGGSRTVQVKDPSLRARLGQLKPGNMVDITYTQAAALSIRKAP